MYNNPMYQQSQGTYQPSDGDIKGLAQRYMNYHVMAQMRDGSKFDGIIVNMDDNGVTMLVPEEMDEDQVRQADEEEVGRQFGFGGGRRRFRRFHRRHFPFPSFSFIFPFPFFFPW